MSYPDPNERTLKAETEPETSEQLAWSITKECLAYLKLKGESLQTYSECVYALLPNNIGGTTIKVIDTGVKLAGRLSYLIDKHIAKNKFMIGSTEINGVRYIACMEFIRRMVFPYNTVKMLQNDDTFPKKSLEVAFDERLTNIEQSIEKICIAIERMKPKKVKEED